MELYQVIKRPLITEKGTKQKEQYNQLAFVVDQQANKVSVRNAIESIFKVKVLNVRMMKVRGKQRRVGRNAGKRG